MSKKFTRVIEDFECGNCGATVKGNGYTNHCPNCLYSKHVDINPGDRACNCHGLMKPTSVEQTRDGFVIIQECQKCGHIRRQKSSPDDNFETMLKINKNRIK
ncbi:MAG: RNHCP domain-containing protein [Alphaproteobacteria bacterium]|nr:RNHCP domain-containing protein [Alphaproteobacteria bacterium]